MEGVRLTGLLGKETKMIISMALCAVQEFVLMTQISLEARNSYQRVQKIRASWFCPAAPERAFFLEDMKLPVTFTRHLEIHTVTSQAPLASNS